MNVDDGIVISSTADTISRTTPAGVITVGEEDAILTIVVVSLCVIVTIIVLCSMGIFIDCLHQHNTPLKKKTLRMKVPPFARRRNYNDDGKSLASHMCPTDVNNLEINTSIVIV